MKMLELQQAVRTLWRDRGFTAVAVAMLSLGIGVNGALFTLLDSLSLKALPYEKPEELVEATVSPRRIPLETLAEAQSFAGVAGFQPYGFTVAGEEGPQNVYAYRVSPNLFAVLGVGSALGRPLEATDEGQPVVLLGYDYWRRRFGSPDAVGATMAIDGLAHTIVGVAPADLTIQVRDVSFFVPRPLEGGRVVARLAPGVSQSQAETELQALLANVDLPPLAPGESYSVDLTPIDEAFRPDTAAAVALLLAGAGAMLLIVCANLANLLLVRAQSRSREFAVRAALGAGRVRLAARLLTENLVLASLGGLAGLLLLAWALPMLEAALPGNISRVLRGGDGLGVDARVVGFTFAVSLLTALVFGLAPLRGAWRLNLTGALHGARGVGPAGRGSFGMAMAASETALAVVLLAAAGLTVKNLAMLQARDLGFSAEGVLRAPLDLEESRVPTTEARRQRILDSLERVRALPGVERAGVVAPQLFPFGGPRVGGSPFVVGDPIEVEGRAEVYSADSEYLRSVEIPLLRGRWIAIEDGAEAAPVAVLSQSVTARYWGGADPLGARVRLNPRDPQDPSRTVVGVVGDVRNPIGAQLQPTIYVPIFQTDARGATLMVKAASSADALAEPLRAMLRSTSSDSPAPRVANLETAVADYLSPQRFTTSIYGLLAGVGLLVAALGVYGVMAYWVGSRTSEMGVRMALGARSQDVLATVLKSGGKAIAAGLAAGVAGALSLQRWIASELHDVAPHDPGVLAGVAALMGAVALAASLRPALRAARTNPAAAIKHE